MNLLTKALLEDLLDTQKTVAIYGGGFKPPTKGHFTVAKQTLEQFPEIDELKIFVGQGVRDGITQDESIQIWDIYKKYLSPKVDIEASVAPVKSVLGYAKENPDTKVYWILGARDGDEGDLADIENRTRTLSKYPNLEVKVITTSGGVSGTKTRQAIRDNNKEQFFYLIPDVSEEEKQQVWDLVSPVVKEIVTDTEVICDNCGWEWSIADGGDDLYICHKCGHDNNPDLEEGRKKKSDPKKGTGKKPEGSSRRLYTDENPKDTIHIKFKTKEDIVDTLNKTSFKAKPHVRQSQVINLIYQRVKAAYSKSKDPEVRSRLKRALDYIEKRKEMSKKKTERLNKMKESSDPFGLNELARQFVKEALIETWNPEESFVSLSRYMIDNGMNIKPLPKIKVIKDDEENASLLLGKTAYYDPNNQSITLYTMNRHPKDVLRSFAHEMVHHEQNLEGRLNNINTTNTNEDGNLPEIEKEAYEKGNMMLRNWEDSIKNV